MGNAFPQSIQTQGSGGSGGTQTSYQMNAGPAKTAQPPSTPADVPKIKVSPGAPTDPWTSCQSNITRPSPNSQGSMTKSSGPLTAPPDTQRFSLGHVQTGYGQYKLTLKFDPAASGATSPVIQDNPGCDGMSDASDSEGTQSSPVPRTANIGPHREPDAWRDGKSYYMSRSDQQGSEVTAV